MTTRTLAADLWPAEPATSAVNLTALEGLEPNDFHVDLSGTFWNLKQHRLWVCRNGGTTGSKFWAVVPNNGGTFQLEYRAGRRGEWTGFGDLEDITQVDLDADVLYLIVEGEEHVKSYDVSVYGSAALLRDWNVRPGGLMFVGHQNGGALYVFDLDPMSNAYDETAALHFDRGNGRLYIWHDSGWDTWEVSDLTSTPIAGSSARQLRAVRTFTGPHHRNNEGLTLTSIDECSGGVRNAFLATDGGGYEALTWFTNYAEGCTARSVNKNLAAGTVELTWSGGVSPSTLLRAEDPLLSSGRMRLLDEAPVTSLDDPVLADGRSYFYLVP